MSAILIGFVVADMVGRHILNIQNTARLARIYSRTYVMNSSQSSGALNIQKYAEGTGLVSPSTGFEIYMPRAVRRL